MGVLSLEERHLTTDGRKLTERIEELEVPSDLCAREESPVSKFETRRKCIPFNGREDNCESGTQPPMCVLYCCQKLCTHLSWDRDCSI
mmetsp:Transcript_1352/g.2965  ORF Transcript_1352/g.2965 Transcript_1352/m.2965 type:complete len:88 (+) Transcript_1352:412-675(+)